MNIINKIKRTVKDNFKSERLKSGGPLDKLKMGASLGFDKLMGDFIIAGNGFVTAPPSRLFVKMYGNIDDNGFEIHKFYLDGEDKRILQVIAKNDEIVEVKLLQLLVEVIPQSAEEWDLWFKGADGNPPLLGGLNLDWNDASYTRVWGGQDASYVAPLDHVEQVFFDRTSEPDMKTMQTMLYGRKVGESDEYLYLSVVKSGNERWIEAFVGIAINPIELDVISAD